MPAKTRDGTHSRRADPVAVGSASRQRTVAIVGNPNAGKTSLFNRLTGAQQRVGNYPGVTVERVSAQLEIEGETVECIDVPGLYSLEPVSEDEQVAVGVLDGSYGESKPDLLIYVVDAGNLERNLFFFAQLAERGYPIVVALTMLDLLERSGASVDLPKLTNLLGVDVIPVVAHKGRGLTELRDAIAANLQNPRAPQLELEYPIALEGKVASLRERLARSGLDATQSQVRRVLLDQDPALEEAFREVTGFDEDLAAARQQVKDEGLERHRIPAESRYAWAEMVHRGVVKEADRPRLNLTDKIDWLLTHRVFGMLVFAAIMCGVFLSIYTLADPLMSQIERLFDSLGNLVSPLLEGAPVLQSLVVDGLIGGVGSVLVFLPQILILFFFISVLEGTGYLARAAFLMDRLLGWCGLNGRAFIPLLSSFACAIPGIMSARVMPDAKSRLATILVAPLMSCSARLPVYLLLIGAFIEPRWGPIWAGVALYGMHMVGMIVAIPVALIVNRGFLKGKRLPFLLELPPYQWPKWRDVWLSMYLRGKTFVQTAGTIIVIMSLLIWGLLYFPRSDAATARYEQLYVAEHPSASSQEVAQHVRGQQMENSYLGRFGKTIEPIFRPAGFDWRITTSILAAFPAREVVVPSLGIIFNLGDEVDEGSKDLRTTLHEATWPDGRRLLTPYTAIALMVFFALCCQCMATLATVKRETNSWKWPVFMFLYMTTLAYVAAVLIHQIGSAIG
jgi:ferrous iron transport protein B